MDGIGTWAEWATAAITAISAFGIFLQLRLDHERSRRENAVNVLKEWTAGQKPSSNAVKRLVKSFTQEQCEALVNNRSIYLRDNTENRERVTAALQEKSPDFAKIDAEAAKSATCTTCGAGLRSESACHARHDEIALDQAQVTHLRFVIYAHLNLLESSLAAWNSSIASPKIISEQFSFLNTSPSEALSTLRTAIQHSNGNVNTLPAITNFVSSLTPRVSMPLRLLGSLLWWR